MDNYTKGVLTIIAIALVVIAVKLWEPRSANAVFVDPGPTLGDLYRIEQIADEGEREATMERLAEKTKQGFGELIEALPKDKYPKARAYIENLAKDATTFFDFWFEHKVWIPLNTNAIESAFSQVKNRIWAVGRRWSEPGLMNWLKVVVHKVFYPDSWDQLWAKYLDLDSNFKINLLGVRYQWT